ncbi:unnamed protein product [Protopolystoma xenopodis]|uniref:Uncharacterized protein n=1 Tax=Protopolystoma xenopodis TaxID=117903 RepID=A0A448XR26_9PLAT|nr:unnamed protein product [Protopolystoma xenopodis]
MGPCAKRSTGLPPRRGLRDGACCGCALDPVTGPEALRGCKSELSLPLKCARESDAIAIRPGRWDVKRWDCIGEPVLNRNPPPVPRRPVGEDDSCVSTRTIGGANKWLSRQPDKDRLFIGRRYSQPTRMLRELCLRLQHQHNSTD